MKIFSLFLLLLLFVGCRSAEDAFNDGRLAEATGNKLRAVQFYIETIRLEQSHPLALDRLSTVSSELLQENIATVKTKIANNDGPTALAYITKSEGLLRLVRPYDDSLSLPGNWGNLKTQAEDLTRRHYFSMTEDHIKKRQWDQALIALKKVSQYKPSSKERQKIISLRTQINDFAYKELLEVAANHQAQGKTKEALNCLDQALTYADSTQEKTEISSLKESYRNTIVIQTAEAIKNLIKQKKFSAAEQEAAKLDAYHELFGDQQRDATRLLKSKVFSVWAQELNAQKKYRESWKMTQKALEFDPKNPELVKASEAALAEGRQSFTILPILFTEQSRELSHHLENEFKKSSLKDLSPFVSITSDFDLRDAMRALRVHPQNMTRDQAMRICQRTRSSYAIFREITTYRLEKKFISSRQEQVKRHDKTIAFLPVKKGEFTLRSSMRITIVDAISGHRLLSEEISLDNTLNFDQAFPNEHPNNFILTEKQKSYFDAPGTPEDIIVLEKKAIQTAIGFFNDKIVPAMESFVP